MTARRLLVILYGEVIGHVDQRHPNADPELVYAEEYVAGGATPLGLRLPIRREAHRGRDVRAFLEGILPEDPIVRDRWASALQTDPDDPVGLLAHMGWDCPGAVQFCEPDALGDMQARVDELVPVDEEGIAARLSDLRSQADPSWTLPDEHWSLAGQQSKFALSRRGGRWHEAHGSAATTHIVKPGIGRMHHQALVEHATMAAAREVGLDVARTEFTMFGDESAIVIERYDRLVKGRQVLRVHQEDFCSATGRLPARKYEERGGPSLADMVGVVSRSVRDRPAAMRALGDFAAINYIAGAPDGHSKNISLLLLPGETRLAPLYDLATGFPYERLGFDLSTVAVSIGGRRKLGQVLGKHWDRAARTLSMEPGVYRERVRGLATAFPGAFEDALNKISGSEAREVRDRAMPRLMTHIELLLSRLDDPAAPDRPGNDGRRR